MATGPSCFPRLYAAASLKLGLGLGQRVPGAPFSAALCRGLIEASDSGLQRLRTPLVFRGFMPRPH